MDERTENAASAIVAPSSRWSIVAGGSGEHQPATWEELAASYWYCVYAWWRRAGREPEEAAAWTRGTFGRIAHEIAERREESGTSRLREWIAGQLARFAAEDTMPAPLLALELDLDWAEKRYADEPPGAPGVIFQRRWALTLIEFTATTLHQEYVARGEDALFTELLPFAGFASHDESHYSDAACRTGRTSGAMRKAVFDFRQRQRELLRAFVNDTLLDPADADSETTALLCACDAAGPEAANAPLPSAIASLRPDEILARTMQSVRMTSGGAGHWKEPSIEEAALLFPQYEVVKLLGRGGMGAVYLGRQAELDRLVAIKLLPLEVSVDPDYADRFRREARAMAKLSHPHIIGVFDFGTTREGHLYFVMEYVDGANLHEMIHPRGRGTASGLAPEETLRIMAGVCDALSYAHGKGIVHRDIKPANVMVGVDGSAKVADFGLARLLDPTVQQGHTVTGTVMGTPDYMAPEQKRGMTVDHRADIFSLGVMLYEMLCGETPQGAFEPASARTGFDKRIDGVILRALAQQPDKRFQNAAEMKTALEPIRAAAHNRQRLAQHAASRVAIATPSVLQAEPRVSPASAPPPANSRKPLFLGLGAAAALTIIAASILLRPKPMSPTGQITGFGSSARQATSSGSGSTSVHHSGGWEPLLSDDLWHAKTPNSEFVDGLVYIAPNDEGRGRTRPQPARDGTIRARLLARNGTRGAGVKARSVVGQGAYIAALSVNNGLVRVRLHRVNTGRVTTELGVHEARRQTPEEEMIVLELRIEDEHLEVFLDGRKVIDVHDSELPNAGAWGFTANQGWFESVEVQRLVPGPPQNSAGAKL